MRHHRDRYQILDQHFGFAIKLGNHQGIKPASIIAINNLVITTITAAFDNLEIEVGTKVLVNKFTIVIVVVASIVVINTVANKLVIVNQLSFHS